MCVYFSGFIYFLGCNRIEGFTKRLLLLWAENRLQLEQTAVVTGYMLAL